jgi:phytoene dehydrogenase-like protein
VFAAFQDLPTAGRLGRHLWGAGKASSVGGLEMSRQFLQPADQLLDEHFGDERLKTALAWLGAQSGPPTHEVATADLVGWSALLHSRAPGRAVGGSGRLTVALAERLRRLGGSVRLGDGPPPSPAPATGSPASPPTPASSSRPAPSSPAATC